MNSPKLLSDSLKKIDTSLLSPIGKDYYQKVVDAGFDINYELTGDAANQIIQLSLEPAIKEFCPNDSGTRFKDLEAVKEWISKGRIVVLLTKVLNDRTQVVGYGWVGEGESEKVDNGKATFAIRIGEAGQGQGLGTPFASLIVEVAASVYGVKNIWLETWQSNAGAVHIYHKIGFEDVANEPSFRKTADGHEVEDVRIYMNLPNEKLPNPA